MSNKLLLKKSSVASKVPLITDLDYGELAINYQDGKLYYKKADNTIDSFTSASAVITGVSSFNGRTGSVSLTSSDVNTALGYTAAATTALGTIASQNANSVSLTGGSINGVSIGQTTPADGTFTTLTANTKSTATQIYNAGGNNLLTYSEQFDNAAWVLANVTVSANSVTAPNETATADTITPTATINIHAIARNALTVSAGQQHSLSIYVKPNGYNFVALSMHNGTITAGNEVIQVFNLVNGTVGNSYNTAPTNATITALPNGWYRCSIAWAMTTSSLNPAIFPMNVDANPRIGWVGNGTSGIYIWGAQLEAGSTASSYTPTTSAAVTTVNRAFVGSGSVTAPGLTFNAYPTTGMSPTTSGGISFSASGIEALRLGYVASAVNYFQASGSSTTNGVQFQALGSDTNISQVFQSKGTGAIDLAAGSSGVNISNGGTVTAITRTATGGSYTSIPSVAITAPTTAGGVQATATATMFIASATVQSGGTGYTVNDVLTVVGGTFLGAATFTVATVSGGVITSITLASGGGGYSVLPTNPVSITGGTGTGATLNITAYGLSTTFTITNAGSGYVEQPTVSFSGGGGSGAAAYASVGGGSVLKFLSTSANNIQTPSGNALQFQDGGNATPNALVIKNGSGPQLFPSLNNTDLYLSSAGTGVLRFYTNSIANQQMVVAHTASAVNYVQVTGSATGSNPIISVQGSDAGRGLAVTSKGNANIGFYSGGSAYLQLLINGANNAVNYMQVTGTNAGAAPTLSVGGSDTNIDLALIPKGTGSVVTTGNLVVSNSAASTSTNTGALQVAGGVGIGGSIYVGNKVGFVNTSNVSVVYQVYNPVYNSLDTIFG